MIGALLQLGAVALLCWGLVATIRHDRRRQRGEDDGGGGGFGDGGDAGDCGGDGGGCD